MTSRYKLFLSRWARRLSWSETAQVFETSGDACFGPYSPPSIWPGSAFFRERQIGVDEIAVFKDHKYLTQDDNCNFRLVSSPSGTSSPPLFFGIRQWCFS